MTTSRRKLPIRFWHGMNLKHVLNDLEPADKKQLARLMVGEYKELNLEKLQNTSIYSIRVSRARRILFTTIDVLKKKIALILEILPEHEYLTAKCLNRVVVQQFVKKHHHENVKLSNIIFESVDNIDGFFVAEMPDETNENIELELFECDYSFGKCIVFSDEQQNIQRTFQSPCLIQGLAGAGKTTVVNAIIRDTVEKFHLNHEIPHLPIIYVTQSQDLVNAQRAVWSAHPLSQTPAGAAVQFMTTEQAIAQYSTANRVKGFQALPTLELIDRVKAKIRQLSHKKFTIDAQNINKIMHEMEIIGSCNSAKDYLNLSDDKSNFSNKGQRKLLLDAYTQVAKQLETDKRYSPALYREKVTNLEKRVFLAIVDEAHTGSRLMKWNLRHLSEQFIACVDSLQSMKDHSDVPYLLQNLGTAQNVPANIYTLTTNFRNPKRVLHMVAALNEFRRFVLGGKQDPTEATAFVNANLNASNVGHVRYFEAQKLNELESDINTTREDVAIITSNEKKEAAKVRYRNQQVFTSEEIGGLEYDNIIIDNAFFNNEMLATLYTMIEKYTPSTRANTNKPKEQSEHLNTHHFLNELNTALTRPRKRLYIVGTTPKSRARKFYELLQSFIKNANEAYQSEDDVNLDVKSASTCEAWEARVAQLVAAGKVSLAKDIWVNELRYSEKLFNEKYQPSDTTQNKQESSIKATESALPSKNNLREQLRKKDMTTTLLQSAPNKDCLFIRLISSPVYKDILSELIASHAERFSLLFTELLNRNIIPQAELGLHQTALQSIFSHPIRTSHAEQVAAHSPSFMNRLLVEINGLNKNSPLMTTFTYEGKQLSAPLYLHLGLSLYPIFKHCFINNPNLLTTCMKDWWFYELTSTDYPNGAPFIAHLASQAEKQGDNLSFLDSVNLGVEPFYKQDNTLKLETVVDPLIMTSGGVRIVYRHLLKDKDATATAVFRSDEFMLGQVTTKHNECDDDKKNKDFRLSFIIAKASESHEWWRDYVINHPNPSAFMSLSFTDANGRVKPFGSTLLICDDFRKLILEQAEKNPQFTVNLFNGFDFSEAILLNPDLFALTILEDNGLVFFELLLTVFKSSLLTTEALGSVVKIMLELYDKNPSTTVSVIAYIAKNKPELLLLFVRFYPSFVTFMTNDDLLQLHYNNKKMSLLHLFTISPIKSSRGLLLSTLANASDCHLLKTIPFVNWMVYDLLEPLTKDQFGRRLLLKLIEISDHKIVLKYYNLNEQFISAFLPKQKFGADILVALKLKVAAAKANNEQPHLRTLREDLIGIIATVTDDIVPIETVRSIESLLNSSPQYVRVLARMISDNAIPDITQKLKKVLPKIAFNTRVSADSEPFATLFMKLGMSTEGIQFISACFKQYQNAWVSFTEAEMKTLFLPFSKSNNLCVVSTLCFFDVFALENIYRFYPFCRNTIKEQLLGHTNLYQYDNYDSNLFCHILRLITTKFNDASLVVNLSRMDESLDGILSIVDLNFLKSAANTQGQINLFMMLSDSGADILEKAINILLTHDQSKETRISLIELVLNPYVFSNGIPTTSFYYLIQSTNGISILRKLLFNIEFSNELTDKIVHTMTLTRKKTRYDDSKWNIVAICATLKQARCFFVEFLTQHPHLLNRFPHTAWHAPMDERNKPTTQQNWVSLRYFSQSEEGKQFFETNKDKYASFMPKERARPIIGRYSELEEKTAPSNQRLSNSSASIFSSAQSRGVTQPNPQQKLRK